MEYTLESSIYEMEIAFCKNHYVGRQGDIWASALRSGLRHLLESASEKDASSSSSSVDVAAVN